MSSDSTDMTDTTNPTAADVLTGSARWSVEQGDCLEWLASLPPDSVDLLIFSPPYELARAYGEVQFDLAGEEWVAWMVKVFLAGLRVCKGLVACVCEGQTKDFSWSATPAMLMADLRRMGVTLRKPPVYHRIGIPGGGRPDWWRNDYEFVVCATRGGELPWHDNTATGHPPKWAPGGAMSHRLSDGTRVNQWGKTGGHESGGTQGRNGKRQRKSRPSHVTTTVKHTKTRRRSGTDVVEEQHYTPPVLANPGNVVQEWYTADEVAALLAVGSDVTHHKVGGGKMGSPMSRHNEAPYPETLPDAFIRTWCPPNGVVADCFCGSGTTGASAIHWNRRFVGCDLRQGQVELARRRISEVTPDLFEGKQAQEGE